MRWLAAIAVLGLAACRSEPDFEERYAEAQEEMRTTASEIQDDLDAGLEGVDKEEVTEEQ